VRSLHRPFDTPGNSLAELRMKASSEETWMKAANSGFSIPTAASPMPRLSEEEVVGEWREYEQAVTWAAHREN
jgi:hypothetical protein